MPSSELRPTMAINPMGQALLLGGSQVTSRDAPLPQQVTSPVGVRDGLGFESWQLQALLPHGP